MLLLELQTPKSRYVLDASTVVEIIPLVHYAKVANGPEFLAGLINFRGRAVPVVDLGLLIDKVPCRQRMNTRIVLVEMWVAERKQALFGIIAESISGTRRVDRPTEEISEMLVHELLNAREDDRQQFVQLLDIEKIMGPEKIAFLANYC